MPEEKSNITELDKAVKLSVIIGSLLAGFSIFYYYLFYIPNTEKEKAQQVIQEKQTQLELQEQIEAQRLQAQKEEESVKIEKLEKCFQEAEENYKYAWSVACTKLGVGRKAKKDPNCLLPGYNANLIEQSRREKKEYCFRLYSSR